MRKTYFRFLSLAFFFLGVFFLLNSKTDIIGAIVGISNISSGFSSIFGLVFVLISMIIFFSGESLEEKLEEESLWKKYDFDRAFMMAEDVKKGYLKRKKQSSEPTPIQEMIEKRITGGRIIQEPYREHTYSDHYERESKGARIIDVPSHIETKGKNKGRLKYFNQFADGWYIWVVDDKGNFVVGDRVNTESKRYGHKLPHPVLANGGQVYGAGEVLISKGLIKEYNSASGHYFDRRDPGGFAKQSKEVFEYFKKKAGWKEVRGGARYSKTHDADIDSVNYLFFL